MEQCTVLAAAMAAFNRGNRFWGVILTAVFGAGIVWVLFSFFRKLNRCSVQVDAEVTRLLHSTSTDSDGFTTDTYAPEYTYYYEGSRYVQRAGVYSNGRQYDVGSMVKLRIDPEKPERFLDMKRDLKNTVFFVIVMGVFLAFGIGMLIAK